MTGGGADVGGTSPNSRWIGGGPGDSDFDGAPENAWKATYRLEAGHLATATAICKKS